MEEDGDVYLAYGGPLDGETVFQSGPPLVVVSKDKGVTWTKPLRLGTDLGIVNTRFPVAVAGDDGRAAVGFLGSTTGGNGGETGIGTDMQPNGNAPFTGRWDLYVAFTEDGGRTWRTVDATPDHPVQVGPICTGGTTCGASRNLLDFNDMVIDPKTGKVLVAYADGCPGTAACTTDVRLQKATIARQVGGPVLLTPAAAAAPGRPVAAPPADEAPPSTGGGTGRGTLAATGSDGALGAVGLLLLLGAGWALRRQARTR